MCAATSGLLYSHVLWLQAHRKYAEFCSSKLEQCNTHFELTNTELQVALNLNASQAADSSKALLSVRQEYNALSGQAQLMETRMRTLSMNVGSTQQDVSQKLHAINHVRTQASELSVAFSSLRHEVGTMNNTHRAISAQHAERMTPLQNQHNDRTSMAMQQHAERSRASLEHTRLQQHHLTSSFS